MAHSLMDNFRPSLAPHLNGNKLPPQHALVLLRARAVMDNFFTPPPYPPSRSAKGEKAPQLHSRSGYNKKIPDTQPRISCDSPTLSQNYHYHGSSYVKVGSFSPAGFLFISAALEPPKRLISSTKSRPVLSFHVLNLSRSKWQ